jgi:predicted glutamine amidotransferase
MCLLIKEWNVKSMNKQQFWNAWAWNPDGFGMMSLETGKIFKTLDKKTAWEFYKSQIWNNIIHFRFWTSWSHSLEMIHPFKIWKWIYLFHNWVLDNLPEDTLSDTATMCRHFESMYLTSKQIFNNNFIYILEKISEGYNKFIVATKWDFYIVWERLWFWIWDNWYSNNWAGVKHSDYYWVIKRNWVNKKLNKKEEDEYWDKYYNDLEEDYYGKLDYR